MKVTRIDIEGPNGTATITRDGRCIHINGQHLVKAIETKDGRTCVVSKPFRLQADAAHPANPPVAQRNWTVARELQHYLDGYIGTQGDVADYLRVIQNFED
jgi:hypothetical protein